MKTKHRKDIKRLSTAMERGSKIAKESGIKQVISSFLEHKWDENGEEVVCGACALGMAAIGVFGVKGAESMDEELILAHFGLRDVENTCLAKKVGNEDFVKTVGESVVVANDSRKKKIPTIVKALKECKL